MKLSAPGLLPRAHLPGSFEERRELGARVWNTDNSIVSRQEKQVYTDRGIWVYVLSTDRSSSENGAAARALGRRQCRGCPPGRRGPSLLGACMLLGPSALCSLPTFASIPAPLKT